MSKLYVAFLWHHHQPYYGEDGVCSLPWVRLHGIAAYAGMARMHYEAPEMRATFNLVPSLIEQIRGYAEGALTDEWLRLTDSLVTEDAGSALLEGIQEEGIQGIQRGIQRGFRVSP